jgi:magnesium transporter
VLKLKADVIVTAMREEHDLTYDSFPDCLHVGLVDCRRKEGELEIRKVNLVIGDGFLVTYARDYTHFIGEVRKAYRADFLRFAKSPSFLIYELWDHLIRSFEHTQKSFEQDVDQLQKMMVGEVHDRIFADVSKLGSDLLHFRKQVAPARAVLTELATRRSLYVSEATQPFLLAMVGRLEHILADVVLNRDIVSDSLELYMSIVGYRTNMVMNRLTMVTIASLPLTFLSAIFGMEHVTDLPELGFAGFVFLALGLTGGVLYLVRRMHLL